MLFSITWVIGLNGAWFTVLGQEVSGRDFVLIVGGLFLLAKSTHEIHNSLESVSDSHQANAVAGLWSVLIQITVLDIVFSLDSVITAVGLANQISIMAIAIVLAVAAMLLAARSIGEFVDEHPTI